jgi:hypothetical protein
VTSEGEIDGVIAGLNTRLRKFKEEWGVECLERARVRTPVDTGALRGAWHFVIKATDIVISNGMDYAYWVENGTQKMAPRGMLATTLLEADQITEVARQKAGLK